MAEIRAGNEPGPQRPGIDGMIDHAMKKYDALIKALDPGSEGWTPGKLLLGQHATMMFTIASDAASNQMKSQQDACMSCARNMK